MTFIREKNTCPFAEKCRILRKIKAIYGFCLYQPQFQKVCLIYKQYARMGIREKVIFT